MGRVSQQPFSLACVVPERGRSLRCFHVPGGSPIYFGMTSALSFFPAKGTEDLLSPSSGRFLVFLFSCFLVFLFSCFLVFFFSSFLLFFFSSFLLFFFSSFLLFLSSCLLLFFSSSVPPFPLSTFSLFLALFSILDRS
ncbi:hypothetical protein SODALDRAFT_202684 [Sodiomyces alkalinus F11]|uniref:Uncharacterized protein n=1 Tax=Sodiomyces alkalinus (strain CBS 110278 / VKM F-3762 / F11) TaxID=1314773 RepID=A0A3N2PT38_SODAK|nr:hypothetical protein SODALDRAFT_202684 [Sodiomyces alkalinus F11]ROT37677.1 hypothetical protein SODALDRAFT_202684 [Sodiomyces alkalinus F11]